ncbi:MAG: hypothetical protein JSU86_01990 [Phycisphaerales bacterium]|nr:MAG: hypothetical protein JSU86_01990 [Phycisphaerales bacterium]
MFAPGVRIDWERRVVEVDAEIVLRKGPLELLACSSHTREHESILVVRARPMNIFQAMGLIGLQPGSPVRYDEEQGRWLAPVGEPVEIKVRYREGENVRTVPVRKWLMDVQRRRPPERISWVFSGSQTFENGRFGADVDGTVVCVVDFDTALITVGALHSADNELLWLEANTEAIPPVGTPCTLLIRSAAERTIEVKVAADGTLRRRDVPVSIPDLARAVRREKRDAAAITVLLQVVPGVPTAKIRPVVDSLVRAGIDRAWIKIEQETRQPRSAKPPKSRTNS